VRLSIDTGSSDLWVNTPSSQICQSRQGPCSVAGTYTANTSSTYKYVSSVFNVSYVDGSGATGDYATDDVSIGSQTLKGLQFGIGYNSGSTQGILGVGYVADESQVNSAHQKPYSNTPQAMVDGGLIKSNAYSLWLDDLAASTGSILFGGVDTDKYTGELNTLPIQKVIGQYAEFIITMTGASVANNGKTTSLTQDLPAAVILDSGSSISYLPNDLTNAIYTALSVQYNQRSGNALANCNLANEQITLNFTFTSFSISVPISELVINPNGQLASNSQFSNQATCLFGISPSRGATPVLGDTFLRSAYVVYDLANNQISMAQTNFNSTTSNVKEIGTGSGSVPGASVVSNAVQATVTQAGGARGPGITATSTSTSTSGSWSLRAPWGVLAWVVVAVAVIAAA